MVVPENPTEENLSLLLRELRVPVYVDGVLTLLPPHPGLAGLAVAAPLLARLDADQVFYLRRYEELRGPVNAGTVLQGGDGLLTISLLTADSEQDDDRYGGGFIWACSPCLPGVTI